MPFILICGLYLFIPYKLIRSTFLLKNDLSLGHLFYVIACVNMCLEDTLFFLCVLTILLTVFNRYNHILLVPYRSIPLKIDGLECLCFSNLMNEKTNYSR
jgi:hypothetical protein